MSFADDMKAAADAVHQFKGDSLARIQKQLNEAKNPRLDVKHGLNAKTGQVTLWLRVYGEDADGVMQPCGEWENASHICPPSCD